MAGIQSCQWCGQAMVPIIKPGGAPTGAYCCRHCDVPHQAYTCKICKLMRVTP